MVVHCSANPPVSINDRQGCVLSLCVQQFMASRMYHSDMTLNYSEAEYKSAVRLAYAYAHHQAQA